MHRAAAGRASWPSVAALLTITIAASQTWFTSTTVLAGGDVAPPVGTAWLGRLFEPWAWSGSSLGAPNTLAQQLPWALVDAIVHQLGGSGALAQRLWLSGLFVGAALSAYWLLRLLGIGPIAAVAGATVYVFNPYVLSAVGVNDVFLATLALAALWPVLVLSVALSRWRLRKGLVAFVATAPLAGFVYQNPPLLGLAAAGAVVAGVVAPRLGDRQIRLRGLTVAGAGLLAVAVASSYWLVPSVLQLGNLGGALSTTSRWAWTEGRTSVANGLWLNTTWGWKFPAYYPYAHLYDEFPLSVAKFLLPAAAFAALVVVGPPSGPRNRLRLRLAAGAAIVSLLLIVLGTGTNLPGSIIFEPFYHLPLGWLLQEPGRFLMAAALGYGTMAAVMVDVLGEAVTRRLSRLSDARPRSLPGWRRWWPIMPTTAVMALALVVAFPTASGALVPTYGRSVPMAHVRVPRYWSSLAADLNRTAPHATVLVLPPDDFYQMPYRWYYGNDGFITNLLSAHVLDPNGQGYTPSSAELLEVVDQVASALLAHRWSLVDELAGSVGANELLVRGDIVANTPHRSIVSPAALATALARDPQARLVDHAGPLRVYGLPVERSTHTRALATVNTDQPDLALLSDLPPGTNLVSAAPLEGVPSVLQPPPVTDWPIVDGALETKLDEPADWNYRLRVVPTPSLPAPEAGTGARGGATVRVVHRFSGGGRRVALRLALGRSLLSDGDFAGGAWGPVGNCDAVPGTTAQANIRAVVIPRGGPEADPLLRLSARADRACEIHTLRWSSGPVLVTLAYRAVAGLPPSVCVWELGPDVCAPTPTLSGRSGWHRLRLLVTPEPGTREMSLFLYATPAASGQVAVSEFADVRVVQYNPPGQPVLLGTPETKPSHPVLLTASNTAFSSSWSGPSHSRHVLVDGLRNGWLTADPPGSVPSPSAIRYRFTDMLHIGWTLSIACAVLSLLGLIPPRGRRGRRPSSPTHDRPRSHIWGLYLFGRPPTKKS